MIKDKVICMEGSKIILCIPGIWTTRSEIIKSVARKSEGYIFAGNVISKVNEPINTFGIEVYDYDKYLADAFEIAGNETFSEEQLNRIKNHSLSMYLVGEGGSIDLVIKLVDAAYALLKSGGLGVKVESSGTANTLEKWSNLHKKNDIVDLFNSFVTIIEETDFYYTCGMHCFGLPDVITFKNQVSIQYTQELMQVFCLYTLIEQPILENGSTFSIDENHSNFTLKHAECRHFSKDDLFYNPYGVWALIKEGL